MGLTVEESKITSELAKLAVELMELDEAKCELRHMGPSICTVKPTHVRLVTCNGGRFLGCKVGQDYAARIMDNPHDLCASCRQPVGECWRIIPI